MAEANELPEGGDSERALREPGLGPWRRPGIAELPAWERQLAVTQQAPLLREVLRLRERLHQMENAELVRAVSGVSSQATFYNPAELPEGGEGGGGGILGGFRGEWPAELPPIDRFAALELQVAELTATVARLVEQVGLTEG